MLAPLRSRFGMSAMMRSKTAIFSSGISERLLFAMMQITKIHATDFADDADLPAGKAVLNTQSPELSALCRVFAWFLQNKGSHEAEVPFIFIFCCAFMKKQLLRSLLVACGFLSVFAIEIKAQSSTPTPDHVVLVILENHHYNQIIGSASAPYINSLANDSFSALFTHSFAIEHPSQPNYIDLFSGGNQGVTNDFVPANIPFSTPNLARQLLDAGKTFVTYSEDLPSQGYNGGSSGAYARKHNPVANWMGTGKNPV